MLVGCLHCCLCVCGGICVKHGGGRKGGNFAGKAGASLRSECVLSGKNQTAVRHFYNVIMLYFLVALFDNTRFASGKKLCKIFLVLLYPTTSWCKFWEKSGNSGRSSVYIGSIKSSYI